ncbi:unnamed protein product, partial [Rotaria sp. Silwood2]
NLTVPPPESKCNPTFADCKRGGCSLNTDCTCYTISDNTQSGSKGICASMMISCSVLTPCEDDRITCKQPETICIESHRCSNQPLCYPIALANTAVCPPLPSLNVTVTIEPQSDVVVCKNATWKRDKIVAGDNGVGFEINQLYHPSYFVIDENQDLYISDWNVHRVVKW